MSERCTLGMGCDETGHCYASYHKKPEMCGRPSVPETGRVTEEEVERVARAICNSMGYHPDLLDREILPDNESPDGWKNWFSFKPEARVALEAARQPVDGEPVDGEPVACGRCNGIADGVTAWLSDRGCLDTGGEVHVGDVIDALNGLYEEPIAPPSGTAPVEVVEALKQAREFIDEEWERNPDRNHPNDRDGIEDRNAMRPKLIARIDIALSAAPAKPF